MKNIKIFFLVLLSLVVVSGIGHAVYAEGESVNFSIINNGAVVFSGDIPLPPSGAVSMSDTDGNAHDVDARSVLNIIKIADDLSSDFNISNLMYYSSFSAFYLKCINLSEELCDGWLYKINGESPESGMDQNILVGGEELKLFFGSDEVDTPPKDEEPTVDDDEEEETTSSGATSGSRAVTKKQTKTEADVLDLPKEENIILAEAAIPKEEVNKIIKPTPPRVVQVKKVESPVIANTASVITSLDEEKEAPKVQEESWFKKFISWLLRF